MREGPRGAPTAEGLRDGCGCWPGCSRAPPQGNGRCESGSPPGGGGGGAAAHASEWAETGRPMAPTRGVARAHRSGRGGPDGAPITERAPRAAPHRLGQPPPKTIHPPQITQRLDRRGPTQNGTTATGQPVGGPARAVRPWGHPKPRKQRLVSLGRSRVRTHTDPTQLPENSGGGQRGPWASQGTCDCETHAFEAKPTAQTEVRVRVPSGDLSSGGISMGACGGVRGFWHDAMGVMISSAAGGAYWPIAIRCPSLGPFPSIGGGAHRLLTAL